MTAIPESQLRAWANAKRYRRIATELARLETARGVFDLQALARDPEGALSGNPEVQVEYDLAPKAGCSVYGYYKPQAVGPSLILIHPALTAERDNFTIIHELGHHVQRQHLAWASVRDSVQGAAGRRLEERVADAFAAEVLIPADSAQGDASWLDARVLAEVYGQVRASRAAVAMRALELAPEGEDATVVVTDLKGTVIFAGALGDDVFAPARGSRQDAIAKLIAKALAEDGFASGDLNDGLAARSGWAQTDLHAEVAIDHFSSHSFAVLKSAQRYGRRPEWERIEYECPSEACGEVFIVDADIVACTSCGEPKCPECRTCACLPSNLTFCPKCTMQYRPAELANPSLHECL